MSESALMWFAVASVFGYPILQVVLPIWFSGAWRWAALVPLLAMVPLLALAQFTGNAFWSILLFFVMPVAGFYLLIVTAARWIAGRAMRPSSRQPTSRHRSFLQILLLTVVGGLVCVGYLILGSGGLYWLMTSWAGIIFAAGIAFTVGIVWVYLNHIKAAPG